MIQHEPGPDITLLHSSLLSSRGIRHAFTTRRGGVSPPPFDGLNLAGSVVSPAGQSGPMDGPANLRRNLACLLEALGWGDITPITARQVHGGNVHIATEALGTPPEADAIITDRPGLAPMVRVADCAPILLADSRGSAVMALHAGWRGVLEGVIKNGITAMADRFATPRQRILAAIGPCIGVDAFEVGEEVAGPFEQRFGAGVVVRGRWGPRPHLDLGGAIVAALGEAGIASEAIDRCELCTFAEAGLFFSHRRDNGRTGRQAAIITPSTAERPPEHAGR